MDMHENASLTSRGDGAQRDRRGPVEGFGGAGVPHHAQDRRQVGRMFPHRGRGGLARPFVKATTHRQAKRGLPSARRSRLCEGGATPASRLPPRSAFRPPPSAASSNGCASIACQRSSLPSPSVAMNGPPLARSSTSTSKSWASSVGSAIGSPAIGPARARPAESAGTMGVWRSTTIPVSPTIPSLRQDASSAQDQASAHQALHPQNQWQSRAPRPDQLARVRLRPGQRHL